MYATPAGRQPSFRASGFGRLAPPTAVPEPTLSRSAPPPGHSLRSVLVGDARVDVVEGVPVLIGREPGDGVVVAALSVSRRHGELRLEDGRLHYRDLDSANGTWRDDERITELDITDAVELRLGGPGGVVLRLAPDGRTTSRPEEAPSPLGRLTGVHAPAAVVRIGRGPGNDLDLDDLRVSRRHAELRQRPDGGYEIADLGSHNGTHVNGRRVERAPVEAGDLVTVGDVLLRLTERGLERFVDDGAVPFRAAGLTVTIGGRRLLDGVGFSLEPSSLLGIVGPSGAGKSTLLNALTGFRPADEGTVEYGGRDVYAAYEDLRSRMGYVPQADILHLELTVRQALEFAAELRFPPDVAAAERTARVTEVIGELGLTERADVVVGKLSGGQRKRVSVGVELLTKPTLLFLDEPTSGLDPGREEDLMRLLRDLARGGRIVVVVTHSLQSLHLCDRVLFLAPGGRTAYFGPPAEAESYFEGATGTRSPAAVFRELEERRDVDWAKRFAADPIATRYVERPLARSAAHGHAAAARPSPVVARRGDARRQFGVLVRRYLAVLRSDPRTIVLLALQAPLFGVLFMLLFGPGIFSPFYAFEATFMSWLLVVGATWLGTSNAVREIVKELPIYRRERTIGLSTGAYLASKAVVLGVITAIQCAILVPIALLRQSLPAEGARGSLPAGLPFGGDVAVPLTGVLGGPQLPELMLDIALAGLAAMAIGLFVSAIVGSSDQASFLLPVMLVGQIVVSVPMLGPARPVLNELGYLSAAQWGTAAVASTVGLNEIRGPFLGTLELARAESEGRPVRPEVSAGRPAWRHDPATWAFDLAAQGGLIAVGIAGAWWALRRRDTELLATRAPAPAAVPPPTPEPAA